MFDIPEFCICIDEDINSDTIKVPLHYLAQENNYKTETIKRENIIPKIKEKKNGEFLIIKPIHYLENYFGYIISSDFLLPLTTDLYHTFLTNIENAIESINNYKKISSMVKELQEISRLDPLTKLLNRGGFFDKAEVLYEYAKSTEQSMHLIFMDLDGLKLVNDNLGHKVGDHFICDFAKILNNCCTKQDLIMRFGGDEFVVFGIGKTKKDTQILIEKIKQNMQKFNDQKGNFYYPYKLSASIGSYSISSDESMTLLQLIEKADKEMYQEKKKKAIKNLNEK